MHDQPLQAPLQDPRRLLDIGCGTGSLTTHMARTYPSADKILGVDLSPVPMADINRPANVEFLTGDFKDLVKERSGTQLEPATFDYVFSRLLIFGMSDWPSYIASAASLLKPGAYLELQEPSFIVYDQHQTCLSTSWRWLQRKRETFSSALGVDIRIGENLAELMRAVGLEDVQVKEYRWVFGKWEGHPETDLIGQYSPKVMFPVMSTAYRRLMKGRMEEAEIEEDVADMKECMGSWDDGRFIPFFVVTGRKAGA